MSYLVRPCCLAMALLCSLTTTRVVAQAAPVEVLTAPAENAPPAEAAATSPGVQPTSVIRGFSFASETDASSVQHASDVSLPPGHPEIILFFDTVSPIRGPVEFRYRLNDYDGDWTVTLNRSAHYRKLTPGDYTFEVQARLPGQAWGKQVAVLPVVQQPFFYQTWYCYLLLLLGLIALAAQLLRQRDQLLKGQMGMVLEERNRIASDCHDTLMAGFAAISWQLEATAKLFRDAGTVDTPAAQSCELARSMVSHCQAEARRIIWDLRDSEELTNVLSQALSRAVTAHRLRDSIETTFEIEGEEIPIAPGAVHHLVCIGQEAVTNAIRHAHSSTIAIRLRYESDALNLSIRDNGRGFQISDPATRTGHFGIPVMEERARKLGGTLRLNTSVDSGTEVSVTVSFQAINLPATQQHYVVPWIGV
ncbi:histidine kinase [Terriglobus saanensis SP1PR4]|uniref:Histidine kinase n=2 Tax=Terriglobus saanensis TaxID=870903 RepID=E8V715_TERSS|nr:histidine kinase [Terriglobus saanensis SP1PR4]